MKKFFTFFTIVMVVFTSNLLAQAYDYLDVPQGLETLNIAIESDTSATGEPKSMMRVYRLERGGYYLLNGSLRSNGDAPLRIFAAEGDGPMPIIIPAVDEQGSADRFIRPDTDTHVKGLYVSGIDNLGGPATKNMIRPEGTGTKVVIDGCFMDHDTQSFVRMNADDQKLFILNSTMRNSYDLVGTNNGRYFDTRGNDQDTIMCQNSTFYLNSDNTIRSAGNPSNVFIIDHCTFNEIGTGSHALTSLSGPAAEGVFDIRQFRHAKITNSLFMNHQWEGDLIAKVDSGVIDYPNPMFGIDTMGTVQTDTIIVGADTTIVDSIIIDFDRSFLAKNNYYGVAEELKAWFVAQDSLAEAEFIPEHQLEMWFENEDYPNFIQENNVKHFVEFTDPPSVERLITFGTYRRETNFSNIDNPDIGADRNGVADAVADLASFGPAEVEYDYSYPASDPAYTAAENGFPVGDLNWFPDKKALWESGGTVDVETVAGILPSNYELEQNYPNPFNPTTNIKFSIPEKSKLNLTIYNIVGQAVVKLVNGKELSAGNYTAKWDGRNSFGSKVSSGIYIYELSNDNVQISKKMILMK